MPKFRFILLLLCSLLLTTPAAYSADRGVLYKVSGGGHSMLLFGTIHVGLATYYPLEARITEAVKDGSVLALEVAPDDKASILGGLRAMMQWSSSGMYKHMTPEGKTRLDKVLKEAKMPLFVAERFSPIALASMLEIIDGLPKGYQAEFGADNHLANLASTNKVPVIGLETSKSQLLLFEQVPIAEQVKMLEETLLKIESGALRAEALRLLSAWERADGQELAAMAADVDTDQSTSGIFSRDVLRQGRHRNMADKLAALLERQDKVVGAIGAAHLIGNGSVPELLSARGLTVERIY